MMDRVLKDEVGRELWGEHKSWLWKMIPIEDVVQAIVTAIQRRAPMTVIPATNTGVARAPGLIRPLIDRIGWRDGQIARMIDQIARRSYH